MAQMVFFLGLAAGCACGIPAALANRVWGTVLTALPMAGWFVLLIAELRDGVSDQEARSLGFGLLGVLIMLGLSEVLLGRVARRRRTNRSAPHKP